MKASSKQLQKHEYIHQGLLESVLQQIFPGDDILSNTRKIASIKNPITGKFLELDIVIASNNLCFEFQDIHHYVTTWYYQHPLLNIKNRDNLKHAMVRELGSTLIVVPCWWDGGKESLATTIAMHRPDLFDEIPTAAFPIPLNPPSHYFTSGVPGVGELMIPCFPMDPKWIQYISPDNPWWMGEKYDGIRVCWNPKHKVLYSRRGYALQFHDSFAQQLPHEFIDSEIWFGRGNVTNSNSLVAGSEFAHWDYLRCLAFDIVPAKEGDQTPFEIRYTSLMNAIPAHHPFATLSYRIKVTTPQKVRNTIKQIIKNLGEGVILRKPQSIYQPGKSENLIKLKVSRGDTEAIVSDIVDDMATLKLPTGAQFSISIHNSNLQLKRGDIVSFSYDHFSPKGVPVNPKLIRIRSDVSWEDILLSQKSDSTLKPTREISAGYWKTGKGKNMRLYFENFARSMQLDPLINSTWYSIPQTAFTDSETGRLILRYFDGDYVRALQYLFPDIHFDDSKFLYVTRVHYKDPSKRRKWLEDVAARKGLDPLSPDTWYKLAKKNLYSIRGAQEVMQYYSNSVVDAVQHLFPEIKLDPEMFPAIIKRHFWRKVSNRREFFIHYAKKHKFDPLVPENWYSTSLQQVIEKGASGFILYYNGSVVSALMDCFPNIGLEASLFQTVPRHYWENPANRRLFLESFAKQNNFDPLIPESWYSVTSQSLAEKGARSMLAYYNGSISKALSDLFPDVQLDLSKFNSAPKNFWRDKENRLQFLNQFAEEQGFNPTIAENWYSSAAAKIVEKKSTGCISFYNGNIVAALLDLFPDIGLDRSKLLNIPKNYWKNTTNQRKVFEQFAKENNFDPLVPTNWYGRSIRPQLKKKANYFIAHYNGSVVQALMHLFGDVEFNKDQF